MAALLGNGVMDAHAHRMVDLHAWFTPAQRSSRFLSLVAACTAAALFAACGGPRAHDGMADLPARKAPAFGIISAGDTLRLTFRKLPELNQTQRVRADGRVNLLQIGSVKAGGKSLDGLEKELTTRYELKSAGDLSVSLESTNIALYVTGAVTKPGKVVLDRPMTLLEAIMESGGFDRATANLKKVSLTRAVNGRYTTRLIDLRHPSAGGEYVQPYDMIEVARYFQ